MLSNHWNFLGLTCTILMFTGAAIERPNTLTVDCPAPITLREGTPYDTTVTGIPKVTSNTGGKVTIGYLEVYQKGDCKNKADLVTRIFTITNAAGDQVRCTQYITIQHLSINDIRIPTDTIIDHPDSLSTLTSKLLRIPKSLGSVRINYFDTRISQNCNIPVSIRRQWSIEDICTGQVRTGTTFMSVHKYFNSFKQIITKSDAVCEEEGFIQLSPVGEFAPYSYRWNTGDSLMYLNNIKAGTYTLTITDRFNCTASVVYDVLSMSQRADIGGIIRNEKGIRVTPDSIVFENENLIKKFCISENAGLHYGFTLKTKTPGQYNYRMAKATQSRDAISTKDIVMIQRHILGIEKFKDTVQNIAADVNFNFQITASDITEIRRIVLGIKETFSIAKPWYFLKSDWRQIAKPNRPIADIEFKGILVQNFPLTNVNVYALKMGDVDFSYTGFHQGSVERSMSTNSAYLSIGLPTAKGIPFYLQTPGPCTGFQFSLNTVPGESFELISDFLQDGEYSFQSNRLSVSWNHPTGILLSPEQAIFYLKGPMPEHWSLSDQLSAECYDDQLQTFSIEILDPKDELLIPSTGHLSFYPNPTKGDLRLFIPNGSNANIEVMNFHGLVIHRDQAKPNNWHTLDLKQLPKGAYLIKLRQTGHQDQMGKLLLF